MSSSPPSGPFSALAVDEGPGQNVLLSLPAEVLRLVLSKVYEQQSPAALLRLSAVCKDLGAAVAAHEVWEAATRALWGRDGESDIQSLSRGLEGAPQRSGWGWCRLYSSRMQIRWQVRKLHKTVTAFQNRISQMALAPGVSSEVLAKAEARLGVRLPLEVWESFRFKNGQEEGSGGGGGVGFADGARLLMLHEVLAEFRELNPSGGEGGAEVDGGVLIPLTASQSPWARECFAANLQGKIFYVKGFSRVLKTRSWSLFLKSLLR